jgi:hypothetical protein
MLSQIQVILHEYVFETLVVTVYLTLMTDEVVPPYLKSMHNCGPSLRREAGRADRWQNPAYPCPSHGGKVNA